MFNEALDCLKRRISKKEAADTGMAMVLLALIVWFMTKDERWTVLAAGLLVATMAFPVVFTPLARVWLGFSLFLGAIVSKVLLSIVFLLLVTPLALLRKLLGHDTMQLKRWKKGQDSVFVLRDHQFSEKDIEHPF